MGLLLFVLALNAIAGFQPGDAGFIAALKKSSPTLKEFEILARKSVSSQSDLVVVLGTTVRLPCAEPACNHPWGTDDRLGIFLQDRTAAPRIYQLAVEPGSKAGCDVRLQRITANEVELACGTEDYFQRLDSHVFFYDAASKSLKKHVTFQPFRGFGVLERDSDRPVFIAGDSQNVIAVAPDGANEGFLVLSDVDAKPYLRRVEMQDMTDLAGTKRFPKPVHDEAAAFGPGKAFRLESSTDGFGMRSHGVVEKSIDGIKQFPLPQSSFEVFRKLRPDEAKDISRKTFERQEVIGPHRVEGEVLWVAKEFYDGEGDHGVGALGYFDMKARAYKMYSPPELAPYSASAMLVRPDSVWVALYRFGEGSTGSGGLVRWDRKTKNIQRYPVKWTVDSIVQHGATLFMSADEGFITLRNNRLEYYFVNRQPSGKFEILPVENFVAH